MNSMWEFSIGNDIFTLNYPIEFIGQKKVLRIWIFMYRKKGQRSLSKEKKNH